MFSQWDHFLPKIKTRRVKIPPRWEVHGSPPINILPTTASLPNNQTSITSLLKCFSVKYTSFTGQRKAVPCFFKNTAVSEHKFCIVLLWLLWDSATQVRQPVATSQAGPSVYLRLWAALHEPIYLCILTSYGTIRARVGATHPADGSNQPLGASECLSKPPKIWSEPKSIWAIRGCAGLVQQGDSSKFELIQPVGLFHCAQYQHLPRG